MPLDAVMVAVGLEEVVTYVLRRKNTIAHYIATHPILQLLLTMERKNGGQ